MRRFLLLTLLVPPLLCLAKATAFATDGWQDVKWGDKESDVRKAYPTAIMAPPNDEKEKSPQGQTCTLKMPYSTGGRSFIVRFCFDADQALRTVILRLISPMNSRSLSQDLAAKYGPPQTLDESGTPLTWLSWRSGGTIIELFAIPTPASLARGSTYTDAIAYLTYTAANNVSNKGL